MYINNKKKGKSVGKDDYDDKEGEKCKMNSW